MKYKNAIERIRSGRMTRGDLLKLRTNAQAKYAAGDVDAAGVLDAIRVAKTADNYVLFMGFCPGADFAERLDIEWKEKGICRFDYLESEVQVERFSQVCSGDLVILKKREKFGETMKLYGYGRVSSIAHDSAGIRYLKMDWADQNLEIEVPLMGCNSTVDMRSIEAVRDVMPEEFWSWLGLPN